MAISPNTTAAISKSRLIEKSIVRNASLWIDIYKGIGVSLVVLGHINANVRLQTFIFVFHMPLFFFISGYLFKPQAGLRDYAKKKILHLIVPYCSFLAVATALLVSVALHKHHPVSDILFNSLWGGDKLRGPERIFWFITCLFFVQQLANYVYTRSSAKIAWILAAVSLLLSYFNYVYLPAIGLPLGLNVCLYGFPLFVVGYAMKGFRFQSTSVLLLAVSGSLFTAYAVWTGALNLRFDMRDHMYGVPFLSFGLSICLIRLTILASLSLAHVRAIARAAALIGSASMGIMFLHSYFPILLPRVFSEQRLISFPLTLGASFAGTLLLNRSQKLRILFLGQTNDIFARNWKEK